MYPLKLHPSITPERWSQFAREKQIFMTGNEVQRLKFGLDSGLDEVTLKETFERGIELLDLTIDCQQGNLRKELLRFREVFVVLYLLNKEELLERRGFVDELYKILLQLCPGTDILLEGSTLQT